MTNADLFQILQSYETACDFAEQGIRKTCAAKKTPEGVSFEEYFEHKVRVFVRSNLARIYKYSESPLETAFFASLQFNFLIGAPDQLMIDVPVTEDIEDNIKRYRSMTESAYQSYLFYKNLPEDVRPPTYKEFLRHWIDIPDSGMTEDGAEYLDQEATHGYQLFEYNSVRVALQPRFSNFYGNGRGIRPDALIWVPSNPKVKILIECDGFEHHGKKEAFTADRQRDRRLSRMGYSIRRYSGSELYHDVMGATSELWNSLREDCSFGYEHGDKWHKEFVKKSRKFITPSPRVIESWRERKALAMGASI